MLQYLATFKSFFGPLRLFESYSFLILLGMYISFIIGFFAIPKLSKKLPSDRGKVLSVQGEKSAGKPTGAGLIFISIFFLVSILIIKFSSEIYAILFFTFATMLTGYFDDKSCNPWGEYKKAIIDMILAIGISLFLYHYTSTKIWLPFTNKILTWDWYIFIPISSIIIWLSINTTNCSDGVDGLSSVLVLVSLIVLGFIMYSILGHIKISSYLLLPHIANGAQWAVMIFIMAGSLVAYLWYNAYPSEVLMGDAGSRALGFFIGVCIIKTGNPFLYFVISTVLIVNGGTGLVKVAFLRFLNIKIFHNTRFPLHDHVRENRKWSNTQVMIKFFIIQILITIGLLGIFMKIR